MMEEFFARGGKIQKLDSVSTEKSPANPVASQAKSTVQLLNLEEAELFFGENRARNKTDTEDDIRDLLVKVVERNPSFLEKHKIPEKYVQLLPDELRNTARSKTKKVRQKIDAAFIDPELAKILALENPQILKDLGIEQDNTQESGTTDLHTFDN